MATTSSTSASTSTSSSSLGSLNFGSGSALDLDGYYSKLQEAENTKLSAYDTKKNSVQTKISAYSTLKGSLDSMKGLATVMASTDFQKSATATTSANAYIPKATDNTASGTYDIKVNQLASNQSSASTAVADKTAKLGSGSLSITMGNNSAVSVNVANGSLEGVRDAINSAKDDSGNALGVTAAIVTDSKGSYLTLTSKESGEANAFSISATGDSGLTDVVSGITPKVEARNAKLTVNGVDLETTSNQVSNVIPGLELTLSSVSTTSEKTTVNNDTSTWSEGMTQFVNSYNNFLSTVNGLTQYSTDDNAESGALVGDSGARTVRSQMKGLMSNEMLASLKDFGVTAVSLDKTNASRPAGSLQIDSTKLSQALTTNPDGFKKLMVGEGGKSGLMGQISSKVDDLEDSKMGVITTNTNTLNEKVDNITSQKERATTASDYRMKMYKQNFTKLVQFKTTMDAQIESLKAQFKSLNGSSD